MQDLFFLVPKQEEIMLALPSFYTFLYIFFVFVLFLAIHHCVNKKAMRGTATARMENLRKSQRKDKTEKTNRRLASHEMLPPSLPLLSSLPIISFNK